MKDSIKWITRYNNFILLIWYIVSIFNTLFDKTIGMNLKICAEIINIMAISILARVIIMGYKNPKIMHFLACLILMGWFFYYTPQDAKNLGYSVLSNIFYLTIDLYTILFLIYSFLSLLLETQFCKKYKKKIIIFYKFSLAFLAGFAILMYVKFFRIL